MIVCPLCTTAKFHCLKVFSKHVRVRHNFSKEIFNCKQNETCSRSFQNLSSFKRHISIKHTNDVQTNENCLNLVNINNRESVSSHSMNLSDVDFPETNSPTEANVTFENSSKETIPNIALFEETMKTSALNFITKLYSDFNLPRSSIQLMVNNFTEMVSEPVNVLKEFIRNNISLDENNQEKLDQIQYMLNLFSNPFSDLKSEYRRLKYFEEMDTFIRPISLTIGQRKNEKRISDRVILEQIDSCIQYIPIKKTLKAFFELPEVYTVITDYISSLENDDTILQNFIQSDLWKRIKSKFPNKLLCPLFFTVTILKFVIHLEVTLVFIKYVRCTILLLAYLHNFLLNCKTFF